MSNDGRQDYVIFDRYDRVGGHCWPECANKTTRLQTEFSAYHVWCSLAGALRSVLMISIRNISTRGSQIPELLLMFTSNAL